MSIVKEMRKKFEEMPSCEKSPDGMGHHFVPTRAKGYNNVYVQQCKFCGMTL